MAYKNNTSMIVALLVVVALAVFFMNGNDVNEPLRNVRRIHDHDYRYTNTADHHDYHNYGLNPVHQCGNNPNRDLCRMNNMNCYNFVSGDKCHMKYDETGTVIDYPKCMAIAGNWKPYGKNRDGTDKFGCFANPAIFPPNKNYRYEPHDAHVKDGYVFTSDVRPSLAYEKPI